MQVVSRSWESQMNGFSSRASTWDAALLIPSFSSTRVYFSDLQNCKITNFCCLKKKTIYIQSLKQSLMCVMCSGSINCHPYYYWLLAYDYFLTQEESLTMDLAVMGIILRHFPSYNLSPLAPNFLIWPYQSRLLSLKFYPGACSVGTELGQTLAQGGSQSCL